MKKLINFLCLLAAFITSISIVCTLLTTYQFLYVNQIFSTYRTIQIGIFVTMILWAIKFIFFDKGEKRYFYGVLCILISIASLCFIISNVK
ncbi:hypothetical protein [Clostridium fallax]|uniref:Uncharacterized protein n=1 Tax=Clostridium fallax TaxID=1533 RepID=A0A1M4YWY0_9CLOT|nr:hypothetical protein [Clostridium fallax]SHF10293.1 hypothetical protein SAMN05443638_13336 [Clostridium fallax]SQB22278.1 Uncharacterised protein [Clostridium fallax]